MVIVQKRGWVKLLSKSNLTPFYLFTRPLFSLVSEKSFILHEKLLNQSHKKISEQQTKPYTYVLDSDFVVPLLKL